MTLIERLEAAESVDAEIEVLLAEPSLIPLDTVPYGLLNKVSVWLEAKNLKIEKLCAALRAREAGNE